MKTEQKERFSPFGSISAMKIWYVHLLPVLTWERRRKRLVRSFLYKLCTYFQYILLRRQR